MFSSIGEPTSRVISIPTSSEDELYCRDTSDYEQGIVEEEIDYETDPRSGYTDYKTDKHIEASGLSKTNQRRGSALGSASCHHYVDPNNLVERLGLLMLETKAGHDRLYDEMLDISN